MITLTILTKNEEKNLENCINSFKDVQRISQILVIDDNSTDQTREIAKNLGAKVIKRGLDNDFSSQHNFVNKNTKNNWILSIDADERSTPSLVKFLNKVDLETQIKSYSFYRSDLFLGRKLKHGENATNRFIRLFDKRYGKFHFPVHETWVTNKPVQNTNHTIDHKPDRDISSFLKDINEYTDLRSNYLFKSKKRSSLIDIIIYPSIKFLYNYILLLGFLDGMPGLIMALGMSLHSFLVRSKLWHLNQKK